MAKTKLKSYLISISGQLDGMVYYSIGKKTYARRYVIPRNPRSEAQQSNRSLFAEAMDVWKNLGESDKRKYRNKARRLSMRGHNLFISRYIKLHKDENRSKINTGQPVEEPLSPLFSAGDISESQTGAGATPYSLRGSTVSALMLSIYPLYSVPV